MSNATKARVAFLPPLIGHAGRRSFPGNFLGGDFVIRLWHL
jgi:hypothetical protein